MGKLINLGNTQPIQSVAVSPDEAIFVTSEGKVDSWKDDERPKTIGRLQLRVWDARSGEVLRTVPLDKPVYDIAFSADGQYLAARKSRNIVLFDTADWSQIRTLNLHSGYAGGYVYFAAGNRVVASEGSNLGKGDPGVGIWSADGQLEHFLHTKKEWPKLILSRDKRIIAVADGELLRLWNIETGVELLRQPFDGHSFIFVGPDDQLFVEKKDGSEQLLQIPWETQDLINEACRRLQRPLSEREQRQYLGGDSSSQACDTFKNFRGGI